MNAIILTPGDLAIAASLIVIDAAISLWFQLGLHRRIAIAALRMVLQLVAIGFVLRFIFNLNNPGDLTRIARGEEIGTAVTFE